MIYYIIHDDVNLIAVTTDGFIANEFIDYHSNIKGMTLKKKEYDDENLLGDGSGVEDYVIDEWTTDMRVLHTTPVILDLVSQYISNLSDRIIDDTSFIFNIIQEEYLCFSQEEQLILANYIDTMDMIPNKLTDSFYYGADVEVNLDYIIQDIICVKYQHLINYRKEVY